MTHPLLHDPVLSAIPVVHGFKVLWPYVLVRRIGAGAMGAVYQATHVRLTSKSVAVKCLFASAEHADPDAVERFRREAQTAARVEARQLVAVSDVDHRYGLHYIVMDLLDGENCQARVQRKGALQPREAVTIARELGLGLAAAHDARVVHRDVKPGNLVVTRQGDVKLLDLGIAKSADADDGVRTVTNSVMGTPQYMAPEQFESATLACPQSDVYAAGATLAFLVTGRHLVSGDTVVQIHRKLERDGFPDLANVDASLPAALADLVRRATDRAIGARHPDGRAFAEAAEECLAKIGGAVRLADPDAGLRPESQEGVVPTRTQLERIVAAAGRDGSKIDEFPATLVGDAGAPVRADAAFPRTFDSGAGPATPKIPTVSTTDATIPPTRHAQADDRAAGTPRTPPSTPPSTPPYTPPSTPPTRPDPSRGDALPRREDPPVVARPAKSKAGLVAAAGVVVALIGGIAIWSFLPDDEKKEPSPDPRPAPVRGTGDSKGTVGDTSGGTAGGTADGTTGGTKDNADAAGGTKPAPDHTDGTKRDGAPLPPDPVADIRDAAKRSDWPAMFTKLAESNLTHPGAGSAAAKSIDEALAAFDAGVPEDMSTVSCEREQRVPGLLGHLAVLCDRAWPRAFLLRFEAENHYAAPGFLAPGEPPEGWRTEAIARLERAESADAARARRYRDDVDAAARAAEIRRAAAAKDWAAMFGLLNRWELPFTKAPEGVRAAVDGALRDFADAVPEDVWTPASERAVAVPHLAADLAALCERGWPRAFLLRFETENHYDDLDQLDVSTDPAERLAWKESSLRGLARAREAGAAQASFYESDVHAIFREYTECVRLLVEIADHVPDARARLAWRSYLARNPTPVGDTPLPDPKTPGQTWHGYGLLLVQDESVRKASLRAEYMYAVLLRDGLKDAAGGNAAMTRAAQAGHPKALYEIVYAASVDEPWAAGVLRTMRTRPWRTALGRVPLLGSSRSHGPDMKPHIEKTLQRFGLRP